MKFLKTNPSLVSCILAVAIFFASMNTGQTADKKSDSETLQAMKAKAIAYMKKEQKEDGSWSTPDRIGITALVVTSLLQVGLEADDPAVAKATTFLKQFIQKDGGIYHPKSKHRNYETSLSIVAFQATGQSKQFDETVGNAVLFLKDLQWDEGEGLVSSDTGFGGAGYGKHGRPDLSNTQYFLEALKAAGIKKDDPAFQKALLFISRTQNLKSPENMTGFAEKADKDDKGGFYYTPAAGGTSQAGKNDQGGLRSYGSMTYAGLKSMIFAGLSKDDFRVKAAFNWIQKRYSLKENPGLGQQGLYYYYHTFAKTLNVLEMGTIETSDGEKHNWKSDLIKVLSESQRSDGSWFNKADRWYEGDPHLVTGYVLMTLSQCEEVSK